MIINTTECVEEEKTNRRQKKRKKQLSMNSVFFSSCFFFSSHSHLGMNTYGLFFFSTSFVRLMLLVRLLPFIQYLLFVFSLWIFLYDLAYRWEGSHCCCCCFLLVACSSIRFLRFYFFFASSCFLLWLNQIFFFALSVNALLGFCMDLNKFVFNEAKIIFKNGKKRIWFLFNRTRLHPKNFKTSFSFSFFVQLNCCLIAQCVYKTIL